MFSVPVHKYAPPAYPTPIPRAVRFKGQGQNCYMGRPYVAAEAEDTSAYKRTISFWVKYAELNRQQMILGFSTADVASRWEVWQGANSGILFYAYSQGTAYAAFQSAPINDATKWHHVFLQLDTLLATAADRIKMWIDGVQVPPGGATYIPQNYGLPISSVASVPGQQYLNNIGVYSGPSYEFNGYLADLHVIDGYILPISDFAVQAGQWAPVRNKPKFYGKNGWQMYFPSYGTPTELGYDTSYRTNLLPYSQNYGSPNWAPTGGVTVNANAYTAPDGSTTGWAIGDTSAADFACIQSQTLTSYAPGVVNRYSAFLLKDSVPASTRQVGLRVYYGPSTSLADVLVDTQAGVAVAGAVTGSAVLTGILVEDYGLWWRVSWSCKSDAVGDNSLFMQVYPALAIDDVYYPNVTGSCGLWGVQVQNSLWSGATTLYRPTDSLSIPNPRDFGVTGMSVAADPYNDSVTDTPTNNHATLGIADANGGGNVLYWANLYGVTVADGDNLASYIPNNFALGSGKWFWKVWAFGPADANKRGAIGINTCANGQAVPCGNYAYAMPQYNGVVTSSATVNVANVGAAATGDYFCFAFDYDAGKLWIKKNAAPDPATETPTVQGLPAVGTYRPFFGEASTITASFWAFNFGQQDWGPPPPAGYTYLDFEAGLGGGTAPPVYPEAVFESASTDSSGNYVNIYFTQPLSGSATPGQFQYSLNGTQYNLINLTVSGKTVTGQMSPPAQYGQAIQVTLYGNTTLRTQLTNNLVQDFAWSNAGNNVPNPAPVVLFSGNITIGQDTDSGWYGYDQGQFGSYQGLSGPAVTTFNTNGNNWQLNVAYITQNLSVTSNGGTALFQWFNSYYFYNGPDVFNWVNNVGQTLYVEAVQG